MLMHVTHDTITDEQIRTLHVEACVVGDLALAEQCRMALAGTTPEHLRIRRRRCADAWNQRPDRLTASTITDEQIAALRDELAKRRDIESRGSLVTCQRALTAGPSQAESRRACAVLLNVRARHLARPEARC